MATKVVMEALSPTMEEGRLVKWNKNEGDQIKSGDVLAEVETDKAVMELVARGDGVLRKRLANEGDASPVGTLLAVIANADENIDSIVGSAGASAPAAAPAPADASSSATSRTPRRRVPAPEDQLPPNGWPLREISRTLRSRRSERPSRVDSPSRTVPFQLSFLLRSSMPLAPRSCAPSSR